MSNPNFINQSDLPKPRESKLAADRLIEGDPCFLTWGIAHCGWSDPIWCVGGAAGCLSLKKRQHSIVAYDAFVMDPGITSVSKVIETPRKHWVCRD